MKRKHQRLVLLLLAVGAVLLAMSAVRDQAAFFYAPGDVAAKGLPLDRAVRIGGMVRGGSILWPLLASALGFSLLFGAIVLMRMRAELARNKVEARLKRLSAS